MMMIMMAKITVMMTTTMIIEMPKEEESRRLDQKLSHFKNNLAVIVGQHQFKHMRWKS